METMSCFQFENPSGIDLSDLYILTISKLSLPSKNNRFHFNLSFSEGDVGIPSGRFCSYGYYGFACSVPELRYFHLPYKEFLLIFIDNIDHLEQYYLVLNGKVPVLKGYYHIYTQEPSQFNRECQELVNLVLNSPIAPFNSACILEVQSYYPRTLKLTKCPNYETPYILRTLDSNSNLQKEYIGLQSSSNLQIRSEYVDLTKKESEPMKTNKIYESSESTLEEGKKKENLKGPKKIKGLKNINMICYMNAVLQNLFNAPEFAHYFINGGYNKDLNPNYPGVLSNLFAETLKRTHGLVDYSASDNENRDLEDLAHILRFWIADRFETIKNRTQHDSIEFFKVLLEGLSQELNKVHEIPPYKQLSCAKNEQDFQIKGEEWFQNMLSRENSLVTDLFCGQILNLSSCNNCLSQKGSFEPFWDLALSLNKACFKSENKLENLLKNFLQEENLKTDQAECDNCSKGNITMKTMIWRLPKILIFTFKRFKNNFGAWQKINDTINFPVRELDLNSYVKDSKDWSTKNAKYTLFGMVEHYGSLEGGHYIARSMNLFNQKWYSLNDENVEELSDISKETPDFTCSPSILFYVKSSVLSSREFKNFLF